MNKEMVLTFALFVILLLLTHSICAGDKGFGNESDQLIRPKRNLLCFLGFDSVVKETFHDTLIQMQKCDPFDLGDTPDGKFRQGIFRGLSTLTNKTDVSVQCDGTKLVLSTTLEIRNAEVRYKWYRKYLFKFSGTVWTKANKLNFDLEMTWDVANPSKMNVTSTLLTRLDGFKFGFTGLGPLNPFVKGYVNGLNKVWSSKITKKIQKLIKQSLEQEREPIARQSESHCL